MCFNAVNGKVPPATKIFAGPTSARLMQEREINIYQTSDELIKTRI